MTEPSHDSDLAENELDDKSGLITSRMNVKLFQLPEDSGIGCRVPWGSELVNPFINTSWAATSSVHCLGSFPRIPTRNLHPPVFPLWWRSQPRPPPPASPHHLLKRYGSFSWWSASKQSVSFLSLLWAMRNVLAPKHWDISFSLSLLEFCWKLARFHFTLARDKMASDH